MAKKAITFKEKSFCDEYISNGYNGTQAYLKLVPDSTPQNAKHQADRFLKRELVREYIEEIQKEACANAHITAERIALQLAEIAFVDKGNPLFGSASQLKAIELLQKQGGLQTQKVEANVNTTINITVDE